MNGLVKFSSLASIVGMLTIGSAAYACTVVFDNTNPQAKVFSRSVDLYTSDMPLIMVNPKGIQRDGGYWGFSDY